MPVLYAIKQWKENFENNRSREIKNPSWVAMPNRHDTLGFRTLIARSDGPALYGAWCVIVQVASRCDPHGVLVRDNGSPHTPESLAIKTGISASLIRQCFEVLKDPAIDWIEEGAALPQEGAALPQEGAALPQEGAALPQEGAASSQVARARNERTNEREGQEGSSSSSQRGEPAFGEFPKTFRAVCKRFPTADAVLVHRIVQKSATSYLAVDKPKISEPTDAVYAKAVEVAAEQTRKQTSAALFLKTVPAVIQNWAKCGRSGGDEPRLMFK